MHIFSPNDIDRVRMLVRDLTIKALIPWVEKQLKLLHEVVTNRKSRWEEGGISTVENYMNILIQH